MSTSMDKIQEIVPHLMEYDFQEILQLEKMELRNLFLSNDPSGVKSRNRDAQDDSSPPPLTSLFLYRDLAHQYSETIVRVIG